MVPFEGLIWLIGLGMKALDNLAPISLSVVWVPQYIAMWICVYSFSIWSSWWDLDRKCNTDALIHLLSMFPKTICMSHQKFSYNYALDYYKFLKTQTKYNYVMWVHETSVNNHLSSHFRAKISFHDTSKKVACMVLNWSSSILGSKPVLHTKSAVWVSRYSL